jgi:hypothetical protein
MKKILLIVSLVLLLFSSCDTNYYGAPGSGLGTVASIDAGTFNTNYRRQYGDSLIANNKRFQIPDSLDFINVGYDFLNLQPYHLSSHPQEIYYIQWSGTGFIEVRIAYDVVNKQTIQADTATSNRIKNRFKNEILNKIDSLIEKSPDRDSAIYVSPWE